MQKPIVTIEMENGDIIKTYTGSENKWMLKEYIDGTFYTIGLEDGSLYVLETLYEEKNYITCTIDSVFIFGSTCHIID